MPTSSEQLAENADALAWSLWTELGVSGWQRAHTSHAIDPERLILFTATVGDADPRLFDEATDWCASYGRYVSAVRLRNLLATQTPSVQSAYGRLAATVNAHSSLRWPGATQARTYERSKRSVVADFHAPSLVVLRLRALFGVGARAAVVGAFLADPSARLSAADLTAEAAYTKRNVAEALEALRMAGLLEVRALGNRRLYSLAAAGWLTSVPGGLPESYPRWSNVFRVLERLLAGTRTAEALPERAQTVEASGVLRALSDDLLDVGVRLSERERGADAWPTLQRLARDLSGKWASGAFVSQT